MDLKKTFAVVDDDILIHRFINGILSELNLNLDLQFASTDFTQASKFFEKNSVDILFLDYELNDRLSIDLLEYDNVKNCHIIFISGHPDFLKKEIGPVGLDYFTKPLPIEKFQNKIKSLLNDIEEPNKKKRYKQKIQTLYENSLQPDAKKIVFSSDKDLMTFSLNNLLSCYILNDKVYCVNTSHETMEIQESFSDIVSYLKHNQFKQINKDCIVNGNKTKEANSYFESEGIVFE